jgi:hypothetical protein
MDIEKLQKLYDEWRADGNEEENEEHDFITFEYDCQKKDVRESFSTWAGLEDIIKEEDMQELQNNYYKKYEDMSWLI